MVLRGILAQFRLRLSETVAAAISRVSICCFISGRHVSMSRVFHVPNDA